VRAEESWDVIIAGGGSSGCVLAGRLSEDPSVRVLLIEAGPGDDSPLIRLPKGLAKLLADPRHAYFYGTERHAERPDLKPEILLRGRGLGGTSNVNGIVYHRGQPQDYDEWAALGLHEWSWQQMLPCFRAIEDNPLGETEWRGRGGAVALRVERELPPLAEAIIAAAEGLGLPRKEEPNLPRQLGIGPTAENIDHRSERVTAARAFLPDSVRRRGNLKILLDTRVDRVLFEGRKAVAVLCTRQGATVEYRGREIVLSMGALESPRILQISGIGPAAHLQQLGVDVIVDNPNVGAHYRDHFCYFSQWRLRSHRHSQNRQFSGWRLALNVLRYYALRRGVLATGSIQMVVFPEALAGGTGRPDAEFVYAPYSLSQTPGKDGDIVMEDEPGCSFNTFPLRGTSEGSVMARSRDPADPPLIRPNYLATDYDRAVSIAMVRFLRRLMTQPPLTPYVEGELGEAARAVTDDEIIDVMHRTGSSGYHSVGTCKMGVDGDRTAVLDSRLRVRDVAHLRVVDCSVMPQQVSANTNGPAMAIAWRAAALLREDLRR
jgi:choline dehydrogenase-like flavoprotein